MMSEAVQAKQGSDNAVVRSVPMARANNASKDVGTPNAGA
jgi:hypothetical protein